MVDSLRHRGPDDSGIWQSPDGRVALGHTRLSVLDLSEAGHQPMVGANGQVALVYNGEIYNYPELRQWVLTKGEKLISNCDTEVLLKLYLLEGIDCVDRLIGMFAFGLYDARNQSLFLVRDPAGKKPLYLAQQNGQVVFASELKALCAFPGFKTQIDPTSLMNYLQFDYVPTPKSIYRDVQKVMPGHTVCIQNGRVTQEPFWLLDPTSCFAGTYADACAQMDAHLNEAVRCRLLSDVPLGVFLSGGIDSSAVAYYATQHHAHIKTFSIAFEDASYDESGHAQTVADHLGTDHAVWPVTSQDMLTMLQNVQLPLDEPLGDTSIVPTFLLAQKTRQNVTVVLGGDGGDELFAGYPTFLADLLAQYAHFVPSSFWKMGVDQVDRFIKPTSQYLSTNFKLKQFLKGMMVTEEHRHQKWLGSFAFEEALDLFTDDARLGLQNEKPFSALNVWREESKHWRDKNGLLHEYLRTYLMDEVMVKVDRACMAVSLEARSPMLDQRVVSFAFSLPYEWKFRNRRGKALLKDLMRNRLPQAIIDRPKKGFGMPIASWLRNDLADWARAQFDVLHMVGIDAKKARALHDLHVAGRMDLRKQLWNLIALALFLKHVHAGK